jgi:hypothetical protein
MKFFVVAAVAAATLVFATAASAMRADAKNAPANSPGGWQLTGSGSIRAPLTGIVIGSANGSAHSDTAGLNPKGQFHLFYTSFVDSKMDVECLFVNGNRAGVLGRLENPATYFGTVYPFGGISVTDNGSASSTPRDQVTWWLAQSADVSLCALLATSGGIGPLTDGNFVVKEQLPASAALIGSLAPTAPVAGLVPLR